MTTQQMIDQIEDNCQATATKGALTSGQFQAVDSTLATSQAIDLAQLEALKGALQDCHDRICQITWKPVR